ncbi:hypothetical protein BDV12DRAFT_143843 [Aspergillus spectabilis]
MENLPGGLVSTSVQIPTELVRFDVVDVGDIVQLWKAYSTNPSVHEGVAGYRLQNFFWRIWSSESLANSLSGSTLARLFLQISESTRISFKPTKESEPPLSSLKHEKHQPGPSHGSCTTKQPLPPILKKSNSSSHGGETQKTTRLLLTGLGGESVMRKPSNPPTPIPPSRPVVFGEQSTRQTQKKSFAVASKAKGAKRRPVLMRRKSSQQSSVASTRASSPQSSPALKTFDVLAVQENNLLEDEEETIEPPTTPTTETPKTALPPPPPPPPPNPDPNEDPNDFHLIEEFDPNPSLPETFLHELKYIMHKNTPLPPLRPRCSPPLVGFFDPRACRHWDVRHLSAENYVQPNKSKLVGEGFRGRFAEQMRIAEEEYREWVRVQMEIQMQMQMQMTEHVQNGDGGGGEGDVEAGVAILGSASAQDPETEMYGDIDSPAITATTTAGTVSPELGDLHPQSPGAASTIATSIIAPGSNDGTEAFSLIDVDVITDAGAGGIAVPIPMPMPGGNSFLQTPAGLSVRGPSGISLLVEQARSLAEDSDIEEEEEWGDEEDVR